MLSLAERPIAPEDQEIIKEEYQRKIIPEAVQGGKCANCIRLRGKIWRGLGLYKDIDGQRRNIVLLALHSNACELSECKKPQVIIKNDRVVLLSGCYVGSVGRVKDIEARPSRKKSLQVEIKVTIQEEQKTLYVWILADNVIKEINKEGKCTEEE